MAAVTKKQRIKSVSYNHFKTKKMSTKNEDIVTEVDQKFVWKKSYSIVLLINAGYIVLFYFLMNAYQL